MKIKLNLKVLALAHSINVEKYGWINSKNCNNFDVLK